MAPRLFLIDSHGQLYASYYAIRDLTSPRGEPTGATYGFVATLLKILREEKPDYLVACFDLPGPTHRHEFFKAYKAQRKPMPPDLIVQVERVREILDLAGIPIVQAAGYEADDCIAAMSRKARAAGLEVVICSRDKDLEQLVEPGVVMLDTKSFEPLDTKAIIRKRGVRPEQMRDVLALMGDASDNIPGVPGIGEKTALKLVTEYGTVENLLAHAEEIKGKVGENLRAHKEAALQSRRLVELDAGVPLEIDLETCRTREPKDRAGLARLFRDLGFNKFLEEFAPEAAGTAAVAPEKKIVAHIVDTPAALAQLAAALAAQSAFAFDTETTSLNPREARIVGMSFAWSADEGYYVPLLGPADAACLPLDEVKKALGPILAGPAPETAQGSLFGDDAPAAQRGRPEKPPAARLLVGQNVKYDLMVARTSGLEVAEPIFDTMVAAYLANPGRRQNNLDALALEYFNFTKITTASILGDKKKKKKQDAGLFAEGAEDAERTMDQAPVAQVAEYAVEDAVITWRLKDVLERELESKGLGALARDVEMPLVPVLASMEEMGIAVDPGVLADIATHLAGRMETLEAEIYETAGGAFDINSPQKLAAILFDGFGLQPLKRTSKGARPSTDADVLEELAAEHPLPRLVLEYRQLAKLKGTYVNSLPQLVDARTGRVHTSFNQTVTATGRLSSSDPNLQNIPIRTEEGRQIRRAFVARPFQSPSGDSVLLSAAKNLASAVPSGAEVLRPVTGPQNDSHLPPLGNPVPCTNRRVTQPQSVTLPPPAGGEEWLLLAADYSQIELRMLAHYSGDPALVQAFAEDRDIHTFVAHQIFGVAESEVTEDQRRRAKVVNFSLIYGKTAYGLSRDLGIGVGEAEQFIDAYFERYKGVREFTRQVLEGAKRQGFVQTILGRRREIGEIGAMDPKRLTFAERTAVNTVIQGSAADLIKVAMNRIWRRGRREGRPSRLLIQIHDELIFETPQAALEAEKAWITAELVGAMDLRVPLKVHVAAGKNWMEAE
jgi:DNA polymerase I